MGFLRIAVGLLAWRAIFVTAAGSDSAKPSWQCGEAPIRTRWAALVNPTNSHPEYPRPQMIRSDWLNLNGLWDFAVRGGTNEKPLHYESKILVPFPVESALSGIMRALPENGELWYRKMVRIPSGWKGRHVRLHFGAVDWKCRVWVNGQEIGRHSGGFTRFSLDITHSLHWDREEEILVAAVDPTEGDQPRGKQTRTPEGIFYTANSGIWQTVWLEPVSTICIDELKMTPDVDAKALRLSVATESLSEDLQVEAIASYEGVEAGRVSGACNSELFLSIAQPRLWTCEEPYLYDLEVTLRQGTNVVDRVASYFGLRKIALRSDEHGIARIALNDRFVFQIGVLDQGFWPEGIYAAPTDEALKSDIIFLKEAGFNLARKHVKVEPERWYYWCDKLGLLVWQDMPSGKNATARGRRTFEAELLQMLDNLHNHPAIVVWVLFNEGWGQYDTERLTQWIKTIDPSRLIDNASGWSDTRVGDLVDAHSYPGPDAPESEARRAAVLGEFGGLGLPIDDHSWSSNRWGYQSMANTNGLAAAYAHLLERVWTLHDKRGLSAAVYTQISDVETECNGLLTYDRAMAKLDAATLRIANHTAKRVPLSRAVVSNAHQGPVMWKYTLLSPGPDWFTTEYDASEWKDGASGFGTEVTPGTRIGTVWNTSDIWLRRKFTLGQEDTNSLKLEVHHDEDAEIYLNGVLASRLLGFISGYEEFDILPEAAATLKPGTNSLAVHCHQSVGGQYIDVGLVSPQSARAAQSFKETSP